MYLAEKIAKAFGSELGKTNIQRFSDGEFQPAYEESVREVLFTEEVFCAGIAGNALCAFALYLRIIHAK